MRLTPKEKADELVLRYLRIDNNTKEWFNLYIAKQCALIAVEEMIKEPRMFDCEQVKYSDGSYARSYYEIPNKFWSKVKDEIEKL